MACSQAPPLVVLLSCFVVTAACGVVPGAADNRACPPGMSVVFPSAADAEESLRVFAAVPLANGDVALAYDPDNPSAGDESTPGSPRLGTVRSDGAVTDWELPKVDGVPVSATALPVTAQSDSSVVVYDPTDGRLLIRSPAGEWRVLTDVSPTAVQLAPQVAVDGDGTVILATATAVYMLAADGTQTKIAGAQERDLTEISFPEPPLELPGPALEVSLPLLTGLVVGPDGEVYMSSQTSVLKMSRDGELSLVALATQAGLELAGNLVLLEESEEDMGSLYTGLALSSEGKLLVSDTGRQRLLALGRDSAEVAVEDVSSISDGVVVGRNSDRVLLSREGGKVVCSYDDV